MEDTCIFCKILEGSIPSFVIYEDEKFKVILDRFPASKGHCLILPKNHYKDIFELPEEEAMALYPLTKKIATLLTKSLGAAGINIVQNNGIIAGQTIYHFHLHLVPRYEEDGVILNQTTHGETTIETLQEVADCIKAYQG